MTLTTTELEEIRSAVIRYYQERQHEHVSTFVPELARGAIRADSQGARIGIWRLEERDGQTVLVRHPPVSPVMRYFGVVLQKHEGRWMVKDEFQEVERTDVRE